MDYSELKKKSKDELIEIIRGTRWSRQYWNAECFRLKADLHLLRKRLAAIVDNIQYDRTNKSKGRIKYYSGGKERKNDTTKSKENS